MIEEMRTLIDKLEEITGRRFDLNRLRADYAQGGIED